MSKVEYLSPSSIATFKQCPRRFYYEKIERRPVDPAGVDAQIGTFVHETLEALLTLPADVRHKDSAVQILKDKWAEFEKTTDHMFLEIPQRDFKNRVWKGVNGYLLMEDPAHVVPVALEREMRVEIDGVPFLGYIDRIVDTHGWITVGDLKTGKVPTEKYRDDKLLQLKFYAAALLSVGERADEIELIYVSHGERIGCVVLQSDVDEARMVLTDTWEAVNDPFQDWPVKTGPLCAFCSFENECPQGKLAADRYRKFKRMKEASEKFI